MEMSVSVVDPELERRASIPGEPAPAEEDVEFLHEAGSLPASAEPLGVVLDRVVTFINEVIGADSVFVYVLEGGELVLSASKNPSPEAVDRLKLKVGEGITGWVAQHRKPVAVARDASSDPRFQAFSELPEDRFEAFLSVPVVARGKLIGVINLQHRMPHMHTRREIQIVSMAGFLVGSEIERARLDSTVLQLADQLQTRKLVERAKGVLQRDLGLDEEEAYLTLQRQSRQRRLTMKEVAEAVVLSDEVRRGRKAASASGGAAG